MTNSPWEISATGKSADQLAHRVRVPLKCYNSKMQDINLEPSRRRILPEGEAVPTRHLSLRL